MFFYEGFQSHNVLILFLFFLKVFTCLWQKLILTLIILSKIANPDEISDYIT